MEPTATGHDAIGHDESSVRRWRVSQLRRPGVLGPLAEIYADRIDGVDGLACVGQAIVTEVDPARSGHAKRFRPI
jgi:hypothetical protein